MTSQTVASTILAGESNVAPDELVSPVHPEWDSVPAEIAWLEATPLDAQPSAYVRKAWAEKSHGTVRALTIQAVVAGGSLLLRLGWVTASPRDRVSDNDVYADACGVLFPADGRTAELSSMGSPQNPVAAWYWRAGLDEAISATATGLGTVERDLSTKIRAVGVLRGNEWHVVFSRSLKGDGPSLSGGAEIPVGFAVWCGANAERAGLKSHTPSWHRLAVG
jgi:steroid C-25 hydroxylase gamma subunit